MGASMPTVSPPGSGTSEAPAKRDTTLRHASSSTHSGATTSTRRTRPSAFRYPTFARGCASIRPPPPVPHELGDEALFKSRVLRRAVDRVAHHRGDPGPAPRVDDELPVVQGPENAIDRTRGNSGSERYRSFRSETSMRVAISPPAIRVRSHRYRTSSSSNPPLHGTPSTSRPSGHGVYRIPRGRGGASRSSARASARSLPCPTADTERATTPSA